MSPNFIILIHKKIQKRFSITTGIMSHGNLQNVADIPDRYVNGVEQFDTVFKKAASLTESIIRLHPFSDGNKRTALSTAIVYLFQHGYSVIVPLSAVRYTVIIAKNVLKGQNQTEKTINEFAIWLEKRSYKTKKNAIIKLTKYIIVPYVFYFIISKIGFKKHVDKIFYEWLAIDIYPEYKYESKQIMKFIRDCNFTKKLFE